MTPDRAGTIFRELLQTPEPELGDFARRNGLMGNPAATDLKHARDILKALVVALQSGPGPNWGRVTTAWSTMQAKHGELQESAMGPSKPTWVRDLPTKPTLGDPAPGTSGYTDQQEHRQRFVPGRAQEVAATAPVAPPAVVATPPQPLPPAQPAAPPGPLPPGPYGQGFVAPPPQPAPQPQQPAPQPAAAAYAAPPQPQPQPAAQPAAQQAPPPPRRQPPPPPQGAQEPAPTGSIQDSVARYASFCAACAAAPDRVFATMVEYGIASPEARTELEEDWQDRFDDDPALHQQWEQLFSKFRGQLR